MCLKRGAHSTLRGRPLKLVDKSMYLGSRVSSTESGVNIHRLKAWTAIDRLSIIWESDLAHKIKWYFFQTVAMWILQKALRNSKMGTTQECYGLFWTNPGSNNPRNNRCTATYLPSQNYLIKTNKTCEALLEKHGRAHKWRSSIDSYTWTCQCYSTSKNVFTSALCRHWM